MGNEVKPESSIYRKTSFFDAIEINKRNSFLLLVFIFMLYFALIWALSYVFDIGIGGVMIGLIVLAGYFVAFYFVGDKVLLSMNNAKKAQKKDYPFLFNIVEGLSLASSIPMPQVYVIEDPSPNAFATGRDPQHSSLAVTTGLLKIMDRRELEGVLAHEMSHIATYDVRFVLFAIVMGASIALLSEIAWRSMRFGGGGRREKGNGIVVVIALILMIIAPIIAEFVRFAISRQREYLADSNGARMTRYPAGLASALEKIKNANMPVAAASDATAPLYFSMPVTNFQLFSTHPPIDDRIKRLKGMY